MYSRNFFTENTLFHQKNIWDWNFTNVTLTTRGEIGQLEGEKQELLKELRLAESRSNQVMDEDHTDTLVTLADAKGGHFLSTSYVLFYS